MKSLIVEESESLIVWRSGWEAAFQEMARNGDDQLLMDDLFDDENIEEWK